MSTPLSAYLKACALGAVGKMNNAQVWVPEGLGQRRQTSAWPREGPPPAQTSHCHHLSPIRTNGGARCHFFVHCFFLSFFFFVFCFLLLLLLFLGLLPWHMEVPRLGVESEL